MRNGKKIHNLNLNVLNFYFTFFTSLCTNFFHVFLTPSIKLRYITIKSIENSPSQLIFARLIALQHLLVITQLLYCINKLLIHISFEELLIDADIMIGMHLVELWQTDECCWIDVFDFVVLCSGIKEEK